jgi:hypothetical protein
MLSLARPLESPVVRMLRQSGVVTAHRKSERCQKAHVRNGSIASV